jgi:hypothetical protein
MSLNLSNRFIEREKKRESVRERKKEKERESVRERKRENDYELRRQRRRVRWFVQMTRSFFTACAWRRMRAWEPTARSFSRKEGEGR